MLKTVILYENVLDFSEHEVFEVENVSEFLVTRFEKWPDAGRIYHGDISQISDITPCDEATIERLQSLEGTFHCVIFPEAVLIPYAAYIIAAVLFVAALVMMPNIPTVSQRNTQNPSPNNELSSRTNRARVNGRIPDIVGQVRSTPDLIAQTYNMFENHIEVENSLMCIGRGQYEILDSYDGDTPSDQIPGTTVQVYKPFVNPIPAASVPYFAIGSSLTDEFFNCVRSNSVNGQVLNAPNYNRFAGNSDVTFTYPNEISIPSGTGRTFDNYFKTGDSLTIENGTKYASSIVTAFYIKMTSANSIRLINASIPPGFSVGIFVTLINCDLNIPDDTWVYHLNGTYKITAISTGTEGSDSIVNITFDNPNIVNSHWNEYSLYGDSDYGSVTTSVNTGTVIYSLDGVYTILSITETSIFLSNPASINADWNDLFGTPFPSTSAVLSANGFNWVGPFVLENTNRTGIICNFVALNGLYADNGTTQYSLDVEIQVEITPIDLLNFPIGPPQIASVIIYGSSVVKESRAATLNGGTVGHGRCLIRASRITPTVVDFNGSVVDEIKWRDLYSRAYFDEIVNFGDVTTVRTKTLATAGALSAKERKQNLLVTRQVREWLGGTDFSTYLISTKLARDIIFHVALDPKIGNRNVNEIDFVSINTNTSNLPIIHFGTTESSHFCYTFDKTNISFEETLTTICSAVFCVPYRLGNVIKASFEGETEDSTILFNHRNKLPGTETRTVTFGNQNDNDGIEFEYVSPEDDAVVTYYIPVDKSALNPKKIESIGIRNLNQAHFHAWRHYNKLLYQNVQLEFDATQEADMSIPTDRILVADNTRSKTQDGQIDNQIGMVVYTSQKLTFDPAQSYTMFLQLYDGTVQAIPVTAGPVATSATLSAPPTLPLVTDSDFYAQTTYILVGSDDGRQIAFLVTEKITQENMTSKIRAANYDARFYEHDSDYLTGILS